MTGYHRGELAAQERAGLLEEAAHVAPIIRSELPEAARRFLAQQPVLVVSAVDGSGDVWATMLTGEPPFLTADGPSTLLVGATPGPGDPLRHVLAGPAQVGLLAIDPGTRRRVRMNGTSVPTADGLRIELAEVYPNCPRYIQQREPHRVAGGPGAPEAGSELTGEEAASVATADTFFVATVDLEGNGDVSHRGGDPGFLQVLSATHLRWPDYAGNAMFNTLGNLEVDPRAGLLLPDWRTGTFLHLTGTAVVDWDPAHAAAVPGAQRLVDLTVERVVRVPHASPLRWTEPVRRPLRSA